MVPRSLAKMLALAFVMTIPLASDARAQYFGQYGSPQAPSPQQPYNPSSGGCYSTGGGGHGSCYSISPPTGHWSCYTGCYTPPPHKPFEQHPPDAYYDTLCHDSVKVTHKVTLNRYYPVYIHLREKNVFEGVQIEERWAPVCVLCTKDKPCPKHRDGQAPPDWPGPADPNATAPPVPPMPTSSNAPNPGEAPAQVTASPGEPSPTTTVPAEAPAAPAPTVAAAPSTAPTPAETPAAPAAGSAKQWVWLAYEGVWGYGHQRADGYWEIESRRAPDGAAPQLAAQPGM